MILKLKNFFFTPGLALIIFLISCKPEIKSSEGKLFIIGGGEKSDSMLSELVSLAGVKDQGYMFVLPMASSLPDSAIIWAREDFGNSGVRKITGFNFRKGDIPPQDKLDSLRSAKLIFISGGDQDRFMNAVLGTKVMDAIMEDWRNGAVISGTSAGAAVMSKKMITGNQLRHPDLEGSFPTIEAGNVEIKDGLGFLKDVIIDQHFIKRQRLNRLISVSIENPEVLCVGIDESTAIIVDRNQATVTGVGQVVVIHNNRMKKELHGNLLGTRSLEISVYLPGDRFLLR
jgi:cyanophycinase